MSTSWIVVADRSRCSTYRRTQGMALEPIERIDHPQGRMHEHDVAGDAAHALRAASPKGKNNDAEATVFAKQIAEHLRLGRDGNRFDAIVLVAEPGFLGLVNAALDPATRALVRSEVPKHLTDLSLSELSKHIPALLPS